MAKLEVWFRRQADVLDTETKLKKAKKDKIKEETELKQKDEEMKKLRANEAFKYWIMKKEEEKKYERKKKTEVVDTNNSRNTHKSFQRQGIPIGPYSIAKDLKKIQKKLLTRNYASAYNDYPDKREYASYDEEKVETYSKEHIEDSLQELSSIKKDTPVPDQEPDYY
jgi:hypothetical protein